MGRNFFLSGATELRGRNFGSPTDTSSGELVAQLTPDQIFDAIAIAIDGPRAWDFDLSIDVVLTDLDQTHRLGLRNGVLIHRLRIDADPAAATTVTSTKPRLLGLLAGDTAAPGVQISGDAEVLPRLMSVVVPNDTSFNIVLP